MSDGLSMNIAIAGAAGRMGRSLITLAAVASDITLVAAFEHEGNATLGQDAGELAGIGKVDIPIAVVADYDGPEIDVFIDFTHVDGAIANLAVCRQHGWAMVMGTTGFSEDQRQQIKQAADDIAIVFAPNMSIGVNLCFKLIEMAAQVLQDDVDVEIIEAHHRMKKDAPSGTALEMGRIVANVRGRELQDCAVYGREGNTGARKDGVIGFETIRAGDIVGDHTVLFAGVGERIEITHRATSRENFAKGALKAVIWLANKENGLFDMQDVLGLRA